MDGYGNDTTATGSSDTANAIAQIFATGVTAYTDSQAIQSGYQINDPRYFQSGYPAGVSSYYSPTSAGAPVSTAGSSNVLLYLLVGGVLLYMISKR